MCCCLWFIHYVIQVMVENDDIMWCIYWSMIGWMFIRMWVTFHLNDCFLLVILIFLIVTVKKSGIRCRLLKKAFWIVMAIECILNVEQENKDRMLSAKNAFCISVGNSLHCMWNRNPGIGCRLPKMHFASVNSLQDCILNIEQESRDRMSSAKNSILHQFWKIVWRIVFSVRYPCWM